jgi:hypothetical protein
MRDFTFQLYKQLCTTLKNNHNPVTVAEFIKNKPNNAVILRHDVDKKPQNALFIADIEQSFGIKSTYYFRTIPDSFNKTIIEKIHEMGHEIGFHYEVLDKTKGDFEAAFVLFQDELKQFPYKIETICMHGNPITPWDNRDLWSLYDYKKIGIIGEAYLSLDFKNIEYFTDTGRTWNDRYSIKDFCVGSRRGKPNIRGTHALIDYIRSSSHDICIVTHPQRWNDSYYRWLNELTSQSIKNCVKSGIKLVKKF